VRSTHCQTVDGQDLAWKHGLHGSEVVGVVVAAEPELLASPAAPAPNSAVAGERAGMHFPRADLSRDDASRERDPAWLDAEGTRRLTVAQLSVIVDANVVVKDLRSDRECCFFIVAAKVSRCPKRGLRLRAWAQGEPCR